MCQRLGAPGAGRLHYGALHVKITTLTLQLMSPFTRHDPISYYVVEEKWSMNIEYFTCEFATEFEKTSNINCVIDTYRFIILSFTSTVRYNYEILFFSSVIVHQDRISQQIFTL